MAVKIKMDLKKTDKATEASQRGPRLPWPVLAVNFALLALILVAGFLYTRQQISQIKTEKMNELRAIAALKTSQVSHWLADILADGRFLQDSMNFTAMFTEKFRIKPAAFQKILPAWMKTIKNFEVSGEISILDLQGRLVWPAAGASGPADPALVKELQAVFATGAVSLSDIDFSKTLQRLDLSLRVPISSFPAAGQGLPAMLLISVDPNQFLFPLIQSWPTPSHSAETLLVRREGNEVVYLNELRHRKNTALRLRYPIAKNETPAGRAARGESGFVTGPDYRGVQVLADIQRVPGTAWLLIAKIDQEEVRLLVARQEGVMFTLVFMVFLIVAFSIAYFWRRQQVRQLRGQADLNTALLQSEKRYSHLIENMGEGIGITDLGDKFVFANPASDELFGVQPGKLAGRSLQEFISAADFDKIRRKTASRHVHGKESYELKIVRPEGDERVLQVTVTPSFDESGQFSGTFGIFRDISERKQAEEDLRASNEKLALFMKHSPIFAYIKEVTPTESRVLLASENFQDMIGIPGSQMAGKTMEELFPAEIAAKMTADDRTVVSNGEVLKLDEEFNGRAYTTIKFPISLGNKNLLAGYTLDITERKQAEDALRVKDRALESSINAVALSGLDGKLTYVNPAFLKMWGYSDRGEVEGRSALDFWASPDEAAQVMTALQKTGQWSGEMKAVHKDGGVLDLELTACMILGAGGGPTGMFAAFQDISERKQADDKIRRMLAEKELLLKEVHHRVKNNMMVIGSLLDLQVERVSDLQTVSVLQESRNRIHAMLTIYEKLYRTTDLTHIGLGEYFSELSRELFAAYNIRPGKIKLETAISAIALDIDRTIPCGLIINELVSNTLKYAFPGDRHGRIRIEFGEMEADGKDTTICRDKSRLVPTKQGQAPMYMLTVANNGLPLPAGFDSSKSSGFGLQLVNMLAGQLDGKLQAHSREWTEFRVTFPKDQPK